MKFLIVEPSPLPILIPHGPKYSPQDPVFKYPYSTTGNIIVLYILIFKFLERSLEDKSVWAHVYKHTIRLMLDCLSGLVVSISDY